MATVNDQAEGRQWMLYNGDCTEVLTGLPTESVDLSIYSPPFSQLYVYSASDRDLGNSRSDQQFLEHYAFVIRELLRVTKPGRLAAVHVAQIASQKAKDGVIGMKDFRGDVIRAHQAEAWVYHGEICVDKDPQAQAIRTHSKALLFVQLRKDSSWLRPAMADYILLFRKPGENTVPIHPDITNEEWIEWARPIWYGIKESDTLNASQARETDDERHLAPLQLGVIERAVKLWSNPGDLVLSPFAGIGSEGYVALKFGRRFVGVELKQSYWESAIRNLKRAEQESASGDLFRWAGQSA